MTQQEDALFLARLSDLEARVLKYKSAEFSHFCDPHQRGLFSKEYQPSPFVQTLVWGGLPDSERIMIGLFPDFQEPDAALFPISAVKITGTGRCGHRELMGSILGLGIKRETLGDILPFENFAYVLCEQSMADFLLLHLTRVGRENVKLELADPAALQLPERKFKLIEGTVASLRLDGVLALALGQSRTQICEYIKAGLVNRNWECENNSSCRIEEGDVLSVRRFGRLEVDAILGDTKKGRIRLRIKRYI